ncbi:hypothetical protein PAXRUDRAFT_742012 [Paxillus rubicundulus Ve08.2h10]|uniref:Uncharacterized protein n=1 Tax=Paxillus rubicundulus Ve08.2h10 TaxID=930991 RepID=A0A0D0E235_9AGAM|nr:hypothetical protein PAXRUDRAFT_742012 [Paxillus rubicundulus Ve08.2h10]
MITRERLETSSQTFLVDTKIFILLIRGMLVLTCIARRRGLNGDGPLIIFPRAPHPFGRTEISRETQLELDTSTISYPCFKVGHEQAVPVGELASKRDGQAR